MTHKFDIDPITTGWPMPVKRTVWPWSPPEKNTKVINKTWSHENCQKIPKTEELFNSPDFVAMGATSKLTLWQQVKNWIARGVRL